MSLNALVNHRRIGLAIINCSHHCGGTTKATTIVEPLQPPL